MIAAYRSSKELFKRWLRKWITDGNRSSNLLRASIGRIMELTSRLPWVGAHCARWAGLIRAVEGDHQSALTLYRAAIQRGLGSHPSLNYDLGKSLLRIGDSEGAEVAFRRAMTLAPRECWPVHGLVQSILQQEDPVRLVDELLKAAELLPEHEASQIPFPSYLGPQVFQNEELSRRLGEFVLKHPEAFHAIVLLAQVESIRSNADVATKLFRTACRLCNGQRSVVEEGREGASPSFLILGQAKAGTSALFQYLSMHPSMVAPLIKEPHYWSKYYHLGAQWYRSQFPCLSYDSNLFTGEGSVTSFVHPEAAGRIARDLPNAKFIVLFRDPVARAYSHYWMYRRLRIESRSFEDAIAEEIRKYEVAPMEDLKGWNPERDNGYLIESCALPFFRIWLDYFPPEQFLVLRNEVMNRDLPNTLRRVWRFLGVQEYVPGSFERHNEGRYPPMSSGTKEMLRQWFASHEEELEGFLESNWGFQR